MGHGQFRNIIKTSVFRKVYGMNVHDKSPDEGNKIEEQPDRRRIDKIQLPNERYANAAGHACHVLF